MDVAMKRNFFIFVSLSIAFFLHLFFFNTLIFVFPAKYDEPKPKFYFLGSILKKSEFQKRASISPNITYSPTSSSHTNVERFVTEKGNRVSDPFAIKPIEKPAVSQTTTATQKDTIKSTFGYEKKTEKTAQKINIPEDTKDIDLNIQPYRNLKFRSP